MSSKVLNKQDTRLLLIQAGTDVMLEKGYTNSGIQEVLSKVGVPKGSFYHYFDSKEDFAIAIIEEFDNDFTSTQLPLLRDESISPKQRLRMHCENKIECMRSSQCRKGCLVGNLSQEMADQSEVLRHALSTVMGKWTDMFAACIEAGQQNGEIPKFSNPQKIAEFFISGWEGAVMRAKTIKSLEPLDTFVELMFDNILNPDCKQTAIPPSQI